MLHSERAKLQSGDPRHLARSSELRNPEGWDDMSGTRYSRKRKHQMVVSSSVPSKHRLLVWNHVLEPKDSVGTSVPSIHPVYKVHLTFQTHTKETGRSSKGKEPPHTLTWPSVWKRVLCKETTYWHFSYLGGGAGKHFRTSKGSDVSFHINEGLLPQ